MLTQLARYFRRKRLKLYVRLLNEMDLDINKSQLITEQLASLWRRIRPADVLLIPAVLRGVIMETLWTRNLVELTDTLKSVNQFIVQEKDSQLESLLLRLQERNPVTLDYFLADDKHHPIDEVALLMRLRGLLQEHYELLSQKDNQYYQRLSSKLYFDIVQLTHILVHYSSESAQ